MGQYVYDGWWDENLCRKAPEMPNTILISMLKKGTSGGHFVREGGVSMGTEVRSPEGGTEKRGRRGAGAQGAGKAGQTQMQGTQPEPTGGSTRVFLSACLADPTEERGSQPRLCGISALLSVQLR